MRDPRLVRIAVLVYATALRVLPGSLRREYGRAMVAEFRAAVRAARARHGVLGVVGACVWGAADLGRGFIRQWRVERLLRRTEVITGAGAERVRLGEQMMTAFLEARLAARRLLQQPGFTLTVVLTLALGIGANVAIFAIVHATLIAPLPYPESDRIVWIRHHAPGLQLPDLENGSVTYALYEQHARSFMSIAAVTEAQRNLTGTDEPARVEVLRTTPTIFDVLRVRPRLGRALTEADAESGAPAVAVLTHTGWSRYLGGAPDVVGRSIRLDGVATEIVGVMAPDFAYPDPEAAALLPMRPDPAREGFGAFGIGVMARLRPGVQLAAAQAELTDLQQRIPELDSSVPLEFLQQIDWSVSVRTLRDVTVAAARKTLWIVLGTVGFLLLVACASVANLFLVRADARQREISIRMALGAVRSRIAATFLYESALAGMLGGVCGIIVALFALRALIAAAPAQLPRLHEISIDGTVLLFAAVVSLGAGIFFGLLPLTRPIAAPLSGLAGTSRGHTAGRERQRVRKTLIVAQIALALVLLTGSGLLLRSFQRMRAVDLGFDATGVITFGVSLGDARGKPAAAAIMSEVLEQVRALPGVISAGATNSLPLDPVGYNGGSFLIESRPRAESDIPPVAMFALVTEGLHETLRTSLLQGRALERSDTEQRRRVVLVNESFARSFLGGRALGERISFGGAPDTAWHEIIGVVANVRTFGLREPVRPTAYLPMTTPVSGARPTVMYIAARTTGDPTTLVPPIRRIVQGVDPTTPLTTARTMTRIARDALAEVSFTMMVLCVAALISLLLGAVGLYGVIGYVVSQRTKEIGVRIALGAFPASVRRMVLRQGLVLACIGAALGLMGAVALGRLLDAVLFEVDSRDPAVILASAAVLLLVSCLAAYLPARRASAVSPLEALRTE